MPIGDEFTTVTILRKMQTDQGTIVEAGEGAVVLQVLGPDEFLIEFEIWKVHSADPVFETVKAHRSDLQEVCD